MAILYAPIIDPRVPACVGDNQKQTIKIKVYFTHNRAVAVKNIDGFALKIQDQIGNKDEYTTFENIDYDLEKGWVEFEIKSKQISFAPGYFYKVQIAYTKSNETGPYSTIGITRYLGAQGITLTVKNPQDEELTESGDNINAYNYNGIFSCEAVKSEIVYSYQYKLIETNSEQVILDSGLCYPTANGDMPISIGKTLKQSINYTLEYSIQTINNLVITKKFTLVAGDLIPNCFTGEIETYQDNDAIDNGYVAIKLTSDNMESGHYRLMRRSIDASDEQWDEVDDFTLPYIADSTSYLWKDFSVEHGKTYKYAIQQRSLTQPYLYSQLIEATNTTTVLFEHMFISDGERQLCIQFNPQVSSFKETVLEQKIDTLSSKYPYFFRNGDVRYKEFSISGLIAQIMDASNYSDFITSVNKNEQRINTKSQEALIEVTRDIDFKDERLFKLKVLDWLNNGQPKLFRSATEGNYIIRLMNISLSPQASLGRMLHSFNATAYECADCNIKTLQDKNLFFIKKPSALYLTKINYYGDVNGDGQISLDDLDLFRDYIDKHPIYMDKYVADIDADFRLTQADSIHLQQMAHNKKDKKAISDKTIYSCIINKYPCYFGEKIQITEPYEFYSYAFFNSNGTIIKSKDTFDNDAIGNSIVIPKDACYIQFTVGTDGTSTIVPIVEVLKNEISI